jgi:AmmeMemoRadiSam system protein B
LIHATPDLIFRPLNMVLNWRPGKMQLRKPAVAGSFYPAQPDRLRRQVVELLADAKTAQKFPPKALIAPHAGYIYSGSPAAAAFATLRDGAQTLARVVLIGPAHYVAVRGIALPTVDAFETPLGRVPVDHDALDEITVLPFVSRNDAAHAPEHALEVELPFLQIVLPSFSLLPLVVGNATAQDVAQVLARLWSGPETLIVISSDLSHYHSYETARRLDAATAAAIENCDWTSLGPGQACGYLPIAGLLIEANRHNLKARRLSLCSSGDTAGAREQVVGYGAWMFS